MRKGQREREMKRGIMEKGIFGKKILEKKLSGKRILQKRALERNGLKRSGLKRSGLERSGRSGLKRSAFKSRLLAALLAALCLAASLPAAQVRAEDTHRVFEYDVDTPWTNDDVQEMLDYATYWVGKIDYASAQNGTDPNNERFEELHEGGSTDCSWFVYHVLFRYGLLTKFVHSYEWGNSPGTYPGAHNIGTDLGKAVPGDILCTGEGTRSQNSHVLIYLGDDRVVECASGKGGVVTGSAPHHVRQIVHFDCIPTHDSVKTVDTE